MDIEYNVYLDIRNSQGRSTQNTPVANAARLIGYISQWRKGDFLLINGIGVLSIIDIYHTDFTLNNVTFNEITFKCWKVKKRKRGGRVFSK